MLVFANAVALSNPPSLQSSVLLLNAHYIATRVISVRRAFTLLFKRNKETLEPLAEVVSVENGTYVSYDFDDWAELSVLKHQYEQGDHDWIRTVHSHIAVPRIVRVLTYSKLPRQQVKFNRRNIYARDDSTCQYCGKRFSTSELSLDHIVPRSQNGGDSWENVVCCCVKCNVKKGGRTPAQANMKLIQDPIKPKRSPMLQVKLTDQKYNSWKQFLDAAYWNVELK